MQLPQLGPAPARRWVPSAVPEALGAEENREEERAEARAAGRRPVARRTPASAGPELAPSRQDTETRPLWYSLLGETLSRAQAPGAIQRRKNLRKAGVCPLWMPSGDSSAPPAPAACKASQDLREIPQRSVPEACAHQQTHGQTDRGRLHSTGWTDKQKLRRATFTLCRVEARAPAFYLPTVAWAVSSSLTPPARPSYLWVGGRDSVKPRGPGAQRPRASGR